MPTPGACAEIWSVPLLQNERARRGVFRGEIKATCRPRENTPQRLSADDLSLPVRPWHHYTFCTFFKRSIKTQNRNLINLRIV